MLMSRPITFFYCWAWLWLSFAHETFHNGGNVHAYSYTDSHAHDNIDIDTDPSANQSSSSSRQSQGHSFPIVCTVTLPVTLSDDQSGFSTPQGRTHQKQKQNHNQTALYKNFAAQVDLLKFEQNNNDFVRLIFLVHSERELNYLSSIHNRLNLNSSASTFIVDPQRTQELFATRHPPITTDSDGHMTNKTGRKRYLEDKIYSKISGYSCYRDLAGTIQTMVDLVEHATSIPNLCVTLTDIGDSYLKTQDPSQGHDIWALNITGNGASTHTRLSTTIKSVLFAMFGLHSREIAPPELGAIWAEMLVHGYGHDADLTAILDHTEIHFVLQANPDGREVEESRKLFRRKNLNNRGGGDAATCGEDAYGVDLNRNFPFQWGAQGSGSSTDPCSQVYRGIAPASEPETKAIVDYVSLLFPERQRKVNPESRDEMNVPYAEQTTTGIFLDIHSYGEFLVYPWGYQSDPAPNKVGLETLTRKYASFNKYNITSPGSDEWYQASGVSDDWALGALGAAASTFEIGRDFYESCDYFESKMIQQNLQAFLYAAKVSRAPFSIPKGPDVLSIELAPSSAIVVTENEINIFAIASASRFASSNIDFPLVVAARVSDSKRLPDGFPTSQQTVDTVRLYIDVHPYDNDNGNNGNASPPSGREMFSRYSAGTLLLTANLTIFDILSDIKGPVFGRHSLFVRGVDSDGYAGPVTAVYFEIVPPDDQVTDTPTSTPTVVPTPVPTLEASLEPTGPVHHPTTTVSSSSGRTFSHFGKGWDWIVAITCLPAVGAILRLI